MNLLHADLLANNISKMLKDAKGITAYALARNLRMLTTELTEFHNAKKEAFEKYGTQEGDSLVIKPENMDKYIEEMRKFENEEIPFQPRTLKEEELIDSGLNGEQIYQLLQDIIEN